MLKVLIADDESLAREAIKLLLSKIEDVTDIYEACDGNQALALANQHIPDIIVLDIEMPGMSGIQLNQYLPKKSTVIYATAYNNFAVEAFELNAVDYILKPFDDDRFFAAFQKARDHLSEGFSKRYERLDEIIEQIMLNKTSKYLNRLTIKDPGRIRFVDVDQINYIAGAGNYAELHLNDGKEVLHRETLTGLEKQLNPDVFIRIHRSTIVRRSSICELRPNDKGDYTVMLTDGTQLTLSRSNRSKLSEQAL